MTAAFEELDIRSMAVADTALRTGVLYDLLGRTHHDDVRDATVAQFTKRYHVDPVHADRVQTLALRFLKQLKQDFDPKLDEDDYQLMRYVQWAARLHEIGTSIAQSGFHKHSAYIIANADMPGFSRPEQAFLSRLVLAQRGKLAKVQLEIRQDAEFRLLAFCLRLAIMLYRSRRPLDIKLFDVARGGEGFRLTVKAAWLDSHALTEYGLRAEADEWDSLGFNLTVISI